MEVKYNTPILLRSPFMKPNSERKLEFFVAVTLLLLLLLSSCKCQKEICGTKSNEAIDVMWMIHTNNDIKDSNFLSLKEFLSDMMLWFRISFSNTDTATRHGYLIYSDIVQEVSNYEISLAQAQENFIGLKFLSDRRVNSTHTWLDKALDYLIKNTVASDREGVANVAVVVTTEQPSPTANTIAAATNLIKAGWNIVFLVVASKADIDQIQRFSSDSQLNDKNYYTVGSFRDLKSLEFQEQLARAVCGHSDYTEEIKVRLRRDSDVERGYVNVAKMKPAKQRSTHVVDLFYYNASLAVDGSFVLFDKYCATTRTVREKHWWEVDLQKNYDIEYVTVFSLHDTTKLFDIIGHNGVVANVQQSPQLCGSTTGRVIEASDLFKCVKILDQKRYIRIQQVTEFFHNYMKVCEVGAYTAWPPGYYNVAVGKPASHRTTSVGPPSLSNDGNTNTDLSAGSCSQTKGSYDRKEWWRVDLVEFYDIVGVTLFNTRASYRNLRYIDILAYKDEIGSTGQVDSDVCGSVLHEFFYSFHHFECKLFQKRYIRVQQSRNFQQNYLGLCEVEVWTECEKGKYGRYCELRCDKCNDACDKATGECIKNSVAGTTASTGSTAGAPEQQTSSNSGATAGGVVTVLLVLAGAAFGGMFYYKRRQQKPAPDDEPVPDEEEPPPPPVQHETDEHDPDEIDPDAPPISFEWLWQKPNNRTNKITSADQPAESDQPNDDQADFDQPDLDQPPVSFDWLWQQKQNAK